MSTTLASVVPVAALAFATWVGAETVSTSPSQIFACISTHYSLIRTAVKHDDGTLLPMAVYLGGLASLQSDCASSGASAVPGNPGAYGVAIDVLPCSKTYRLYWYYMSYEIVIIILLVVAAAVGKMRQTQSAFTGLFAIATVYFTLASEQFLTAESIPYYTSGSALNRIRTVVAGAIMTAVMNAVAVLVLGALEHGPIERAANKGATTTATNSPV